MKMIFNNYILRILWAFLLMTFFTVYKLSGQSWFEAFGDSESEHGRYVFQAENGDMVVCGIQYFGTGTYNPGSMIYLVKTDSVGNLLLEKTFGDSGYFWGSQIEETFDNGFLLFSGNIPNVMKLNVNWDTVWCLNSATIKDSTYLFNFVLLKDSTFLFCGVITYLGNREIFLVKINSLGDTMSTKIIITAPDESAPFIHATQDGGFAIFSNFNGNNRELIKLDSSLTPVWINNYSNTIYSYDMSSITTMDNSFITSGTDFISKPLILKIDSSGNMIWGKSYGYLEPYLFPNDYAVFSIAEANNGDYLVTGRCTLGTSVYVYFLRTDTAGNLLCEKYIGPYNVFSTGEFINKTHDNGAVIAGSGIVPGSDYDLFLIKIDSVCGNVVVNMPEPIETVNTTSNSNFVFPNPFSSNLNFRFFFQTSTKYTIELFNMYNQEVAVFTGQQGPGFYQKVIFSGYIFDPGIFTLRLTTEDGIFYKKMIKIN